MEKTIDNIVIGLLKNMLRKNVTFHKEGFSKFDDECFKIVLDASGFDQDEVMCAMDDLCKNNKKWHKKDDKEYLSGDIWGPSYNLTTQFISFYIRNEILIGLRDDILKKAY